MTIKKMTLKVKIHSWVKIPHLIAKWISLILFLFHFSWKFPFKHIYTFAFTSTHRIIQIFPTVYNTGPLFPLGKNKTNKQNPPPPKLNCSSLPCFCKSLALIKWRKSGKIFFFFPHSKMRKSRTHLGERGFHMKHKWCCLTSWSFIRLPEI